jgi:hypothetical protein
MIIITSIYHLCCCGLVYLLLMSVQIQKHILEETLKTTSVQRRLPNVQV